MNETLSSVNDSSSIRRGPKCRALSTTASTPANCTESIVRHVNRAEYLQRSNVEVDSMAWERARTGWFVRDVTLSSLRALVADLVVVLGRMVAFPTFRTCCFPERLKKVCSINDYLSYELYSLTQNYQRVDCRFSCI